MSNYLSEAFKKMDILDEDIFEVDKDGLTALKDFEDSNDEEELVTVVDPDAEDEEELEDSYIGKVILDCSVCHTDIYKDKDEVIIDDESGLANIGEECPYCYSSEGFKVIGEVKPFSEIEVETDDDVDVEVDGEENEEDYLEEKLLNDNDIDLINLKKWIDDVLSSANIEITLQDYPGTNRYAIPCNVTIEDHWFDNEFKLSTLINMAKRFRKLDNSEERLIEWVLHKCGYNKNEENKENFDEFFSRKGLKESCSINQCQKWVDYDMKKYKKISDDTMEKIKSSGYSVVKDQYGDYEVIADRKDESCGKRKSRKMKESIEDITIDTGDQEIQVSARDKEKEPNGDEMIAPLSDEDKMDIEMNTDEDSVDVDVDEFSEEDFDELGESYLKKVYENVKSYKTTSAETKGNKLYLEGLIKFNSGKEKKTNFVFESKTITKTGKAKLIGENLQISRGHKSFKLAGIINNGKLISESLNYNYRVNNGSGESQRIYGTVRKSK